MTNICYSGGSKGADKLFGQLANEEGHFVMHWSFAMHHSEGAPEDTYRLKAIQLLEADPHLKLANQYLQRTFPTRSEYVNNLLRRNYFQVRDAERVYAACRWEGDEFNYKPLGGTAWAIVMGCNLGIKEFYIYDIDNKEWLTYNDNIMNSWSHIAFDDIPKPYSHYAGIGASNLPDHAAEAITKLYKGK